MTRWLVLLLVLAGLATVSLRLLPPEWDPRAPLDLGAPPTAMTAWKLARLHGRPEACRAALGTAGLAIEPVPDTVSDRASEVGCGVEDAVRLPSGVRLAPAGPVVICPLAAAWVLFERHALQPAARTHLGTTVRGVRHLGTYACRNVYHRATGRRSEHATANAIDLAGFTLADGRTVTVLRDWVAAGSTPGAAPAPEAAFLRAVRDGACRWFRAVLGPDYNAAHRDHFHLDRGRWSACR